MGENYFDGEQDLITKLSGIYPGSEALVLEFVKPKKGLEVHSLDILTMRLNSGEIVTLSCIYWGNCTGNTSHTTQSGYLVDAKTGEFLSAVSWYVAYFKDQRHQLPDVKTI